MKPCLDCGTPSKDSYCSEHTKLNAKRDRPRSYERERPYTKASWKRLSKRARKLQPFCIDCGTAGTPSNPLHADHSIAAWQKQAAGKPIGLADIDVLCRSCNSKRGPARGEGIRRAA